MSRSRVAVEVPEATACCGSMLQSALSEKEAVRQGGRVRGARRSGATPPAEPHCDRARRRGVRV